jgi:class 3 adenylate cyclase/tetratricopeptide (TPR) repeat protein
VNTHSLSGDFATQPLEEIIKLWIRRDRGQWPADADLYKRLARHFLDLGEYILAYDVAADGLETFKGDKRRTSICVRLRQFQGWALARSGASEVALAIFASLHKEGHVDEETLGGLARTHKDLGLAATGRDRTMHLHRSHKYYLAAYADKAGNYWTGINAATTALVLGRIKKARQLARKVRDHCFHLCRTGTPPARDRYWLPATVAEAALILDKWEEARKWYLQAVTAAPHDWGNIASSRRAAHLIVAALGKPALREEVNRCLHLPNVVVFAGHMIDRAGRPKARFPASVESLVRNRIRAKLKELDADIGFSSGACGSDILFLEAIRFRKGEFAIVLPYEQQGFVRDSVDIIPGAKWGRRLEQLTAARRPLIASPQHARIAWVTHDYMNLLLHGLAKMRADQLGTRLIPLAVWDGKAGDGRGGTAEVVQRWRTLGLDPQIVDPAPQLSTHLPDLSADDSPILPRPTRRPPRLPREIKAMLFADVVRFSQLTEESFPHFVAYFLGSVARMANESPYKPLIRNTWGDALFFVFESVEQAGCFALDLRDLMKRTNWARLGLGTELGIRIAVHAGPVFAFHDPVARHDGCIGAHVNRAARLEPVTPPGHVYASQEFAALAALREQPFVCDYAGSIPLAKDFGTFPTYHVRRK